ncbi:spermatogenesis-associated protein 45-like [Platichthys flesus]|uniref:spermatogenesis-associated protein 45-like n=1 Tax=Platichthys flesus TaxID=8260 RepID=UPI002DBAF855|nr:spermatogenesis-associated protein 45-like [Platichthys flesus]
MSSREEPALLQLNLRRETWCQVEGDSGQSWERTERRHHRGHLRTSPVLLAALIAGPQPGGGRSERLPPVKLPERRHFEESYKSHLV